MKNSMAGILGPKMAVIYVLSFGKIKTTSHA